MRVVATAGHVDHGKSTLVQALTGTDPDRWAEEKARGLTIDLGFATTTLASGAEVGFVDVPGHGRFIKNMLAGVGVVDACLFVVAATEGWKAQSEEHLRIVDLLGIPAGVVVLTKVAGLSDDDRDLVALDVAERLKGTFLEGAPMVAVDVPAGIGLASLRAALDRLVASVPAAVDRGRPRLWVDRSFPVKGAGTVVTGTLTGGSVAVGDDLVVEPGAHPVRVRSLQSHYRELRSAGPGRRLAVNVVGLAHRQVERGAALVRHGQWQVTRSFDAALTVLADLEHEVSRRGAYAVHIGSATAPARLAVLESAPQGGESAAGGQTVKRVIAPGRSGAVRVWLTGPAGLPLVPGDRYVLRELGRGETVGGGEILDVDPVLPVSVAAPDRRVARVVAERGWVDAEVLARLTGEPAVPTVGRWVVDVDERARAEEALRRRCAEAGTSGIALAAVDERDRALLASGVAGTVVRDDRVVDEAAAGGGLSPAAEAVLGALERSPWAPPQLPVADRAALRELERAGLACQAGDTWFAASAVDAATSLLAGLLAEHPQGFTVADARDLLGTTRKHALPLLAYLDSRGVTRRHGDLRVGGPRLPAAPSKGARP